MTIPTRFQVINPTTQNTMGPHLHTPQSIFQHMMGQQSSSHDLRPWTQIPQVPPMCMPWSTPSLQQPHLIKFTGEAKPQSYDQLIHQKRKSDVIDVSNMRPTKQFISEEKMAAHFSDMHISSNYSATSVPTETQTCNRQPTINNQVELNINANARDIEDGKSMHPRLVISEELKRLQQEPLLPSSLLSKLERPSMALVLWEPPSKHLRMFASRPQTQPQPRQYAEVEDENDNNNNINNNNPQNVDLNQSAFDSNNTELEPMDL